MEDTIRAIVDGYIEDTGANPNPIYYDTAIAIYNETGNLPTWEYITLRSIPIPIIQGNQPHENNDVEDDNSEPDLENADGFFNNMDGDEEIEIEPYDGPTNNLSIGIFNLFNNVIHAATQSGSVRTIPLNLNQTDVKSVLSAETVDAITLSVVNPNTEYLNPCAICYSDFVPTELIRTLRCKHNYHRCCIDKYLKQESHLCPMCKQPASDTHVHINI